MSSIVFLLVIVVFVIVFAKIITQWNKDNHSPRLTVQATVVAKRQHSHHHHGTDLHSHHTSSYYVTFQVDSGDRMELHVPGNEYGLLIEGDRGTLSFQGSRFLGFQRG
jgi:hypothetical protein